MKVITLTTVERRALLNALKPDAIYGQGGDIVILDHLGAIILTFRVFKER